MDNDASKAAAAAGSGTSAEVSGRAVESLGIVACLAMYMAVAYTVEVGWKHFVLHGFVSASRDVLWMAPLSAGAWATVILSPLWLTARLLQCRAARSSAVFGSAWLVTFAALLPWTQIHRVAAAVLALGVASALTRWCFATGRETRLRWLQGIGVGAGVVLVVAGAALHVVRGRQQEAAYAALPPAANGAPNVLVLLLDTVRASALGMYGYERATSPAMDSVAAGGALFEHAVATAPWTLPSHASLFTGEYPGLLSTSFRSPLDASRETLAERFRAAGYETVGFVGNPYYTAWDSGLGRGFLRWLDYNRSVEQVLRSGWIGQSSIALALQRSHRLRDVMDAVRSAEFVVIPKPGGDAPDATRLTDELLAWERTREARPYFAFVNFFDAHEAYAPPARYRTRFADAPGPRDLYDAEIAYVDDEIARMLRGLEARGALRNTIVVITSDHGEQFKEHRISGHGNSLYYHLLHIPLVLRFDARIPGGIRIPHVVSLRDVGATLLDLAGVPSARPFPGRSLAPLLAPAQAQPGATQPIVSPAISELTQDSVPRTDDPLTRSQGISLVEEDGLHGIFRNFKTVRPLLFNVRDDEGELRNLALQDSAGRRAYDAQQSRLRALLRVDQEAVVQR